MVGLRCKERRAVFGGTFDPPHLGHVEAMRVALESGAVETVVVVPAWQSPFKEERSVVSDADRLALVERAVESLGADLASNVEVDTRELQAGRVCYMVETVQSLAAANPNVDWRLLLGADQAQGLPQWKDAQKLCAMALPLFAVRPDHNLEGLAQVLRLLGLPNDDSALRECVLSMTGVKAASREIREALLAGRSPDQLPFPVGVAQAIAKRGLYRGLEKR